VASATVADTFDAKLQNCTWTCSGAGGGSCPAGGSGNINKNVSLPAGASTTFVAQCLISPSATGSLANTVSISSAISDPSSGNNSASDTDTLAASADLGITKTNGVTASTPGGQTTYTIVPSNAGPSDVASATVADTFDAKLQNCTWTCSGAGGGSCPASGSGNINQNVSLPVNGSVSFSANCTIAAAATGSLANIASVTSAVSDPVSGNNSASDTDTLAASADLGITKTNGVTTSTPGSQTTYTIVASNAGPSHAADATVTDTFDDNLQNCNWTCSGAGGASCGVSSGSGHINRSVNLPVNGSVSFSATCTIAVAATGSLVNSASVSSTLSDPVPGNNSAADIDTLPGTADLSISVENEDSTVIAGSSVIYQIVAANAGPAPASHATVSNVFSPKLENCEWLCSASGGASCAAAGAGNINEVVNLPANGEVTFAAICDVDERASDSLVNTATIESAVYDPVPGNNSATSTDVLVQQADLAVSLDAGVSSAAPGSPVTYEIVVVNAGSSQASQAVIKDHFPKALTYCSWTCEGSLGGSCPASGSGHINHSVTLPKGSQVSFSASCTVSPKATGSIVNTAEVSSDIDDPDPDNNQAMDVISLDDDLIFSDSFD
jgi:uncharacterized repeat protein (TIGR01451 family)